MKAHYQGLHVIMSLVTTKCAKLDECNDWPMLEFNQCATMASNPMEKLE
jgi:hypothetical protein